MNTTPPPGPAPADAGQDPGGPGPRDPGPANRDQLRDLANLRRTRHDRKIAGVAGGLARHFDIDPIIPRVVLAVLIFFGGGIILYAALWLVVPQEETEDVVVRLDDRSRTVAVVIAFGLAGLAVLGDSLGGWGFPWPLAVAGALLLAFMLVRGNGPRVHPLLRPGGTPPPYPTYDPAYDPTYDPTTGPVAAPGAPSLAKTPASGPTPPPPGSWVPPTSTHVLPPARPRRRGPVLFWYALALIAAGLGVLGMADLAGAAVADSAYPALALGVSAAMLLLGAFWGRAGGIILLGLVSAVATAGALVADEVDAGRVDQTPTTAAAVSDRYDLTVGEIRLDLSEVSDPENLDGRTIEVEVDFAGRIEVVVPDGVDVVVDSRLDEGDHRVLGDDLDDSAHTTTSLAGGVLDAPELRLDVEMTFGEIDIHREGVRR
ncbi:PspC domain-containing protein [Nocardioides dongxiaopingii]|uniref:PspC domain-containing protein n=1 Tax=Nocardioides TaxID=1839 RepID=UPI0010C76CB3|nr:MULTISPECIES: PspC domain-containing protein [Nocardioides]QDH10771.1 PspC domain-containing protein [Nocardioides sp. S-1144]